MNAVENTPRLETDRLILRKFCKKDLDDMFLLYSDKTANEFLPWFTHTSRTETEAYLHTVILPEYAKPTTWNYAVELKATAQVIGYVVFHQLPDDSWGCDAGYAIGTLFRNRGIITEACLTVLPLLKNAGLKYVTATHDIKNPASGAVMKKIGMHYCYSYIEQWLPKNISVTFRMYQLNFDNFAKTYMGYWNKYGTGFIESLN